MADDTYPQPKHGWTCYWCGETFTTPGAAQDHFGIRPGVEPGCLVRVQVGEERGLLMALRKAEAEIERLRGELSELKRKQHWAGMDSEGYT